ncbi:tetratricopeptide (TPR) repeat protein [Azospirillum agricola]|uniref:tetratricopeptide repeat protein n=1 Tax=Azospirillum agricola TaxID=1720247 RepID=UPI001F200DE4|nr:tetratricopeptide repeat protein [Azospirillum agricola]MBP2233262.1 tetratricopeptide (TPR) repeat protein [Azospirillum agricola]
MESHFIKVLKQHIGPTTEPAATDTFMATIQEALAIAVRHHQDGRLEIATGIYEQILQVAPRHPDALHLMGVALRRRQPAEAARLIREALTQSPELVEARLNLGNVLQDLGLFVEAAAQYRQAAALRPDSDAPLVGLAFSLRVLGRLDEAVTTYRAAIALGPAAAETRNGLANCLQDRKRYAEAATVYGTALALDPVHPSAGNNLSIALRELGRSGEALRWQRRSAARDPSFAAAHTSLGITQQELGRLDEAASSHARALVCDPGFTAGYNNFGNARQSQNRLEEAVVQYRRALRTDPDSADAHRNLGIGLLLAGRFEEGWREYEGRLRCKDVPVLTNLPKPRWNGEPLEGRRVLLHSEQGLGDTIQFCRYAPMIAARGGKAVLGVQPNLGRLLKRLPGGIEVVSGSAPLNAFDLHVPLLSLPLLFGTSLDTIPAPVPYLYPEPEMAASWAERLGHHRGLRVGLVWAGSPGHGNDRNRSLRLEAFAPLTFLPGVTLFSIQKGPTEGQAADPPAGMRLVNLSPEIGDFADTAAIAANLDVILCVDTSVAHLCGALGRPTWVLLPYAPDWRWMLGRDDTPWYPTMRLFRQSRPGVWSDVLVRVEKALRVRAGMAMDAIPA